MKVERRTVCGRFCLILGILIAVTVSSASALPDAKRARSVAVAIEQAIRTNLSNAPSSGAPAPRGSHAADLEASLVNAIRHILEIRSVSDDDAIGALAVIDPSAFADPAAVGGAVAEVRREIVRDLARKGSLVSGPHGDAPSGRGAGSAVVGFRGPVPLPATRPARRPDFPLVQPKPPVAEAWTIPPPSPPPVVKPAASPTSPSRGSASPVSARPDAGPAVPGAAPPPGSPVSAPNSPANSGPASPAGALIAKYNAPSVIALGARTTYRLILLSGHPLLPGDFTGAPGPVGSHAIPAITLARAVMHGPKDLVRVEGESAECQKVTNTDNPTWDWSVTPTTTKSFDLVVDIYGVEDCSAQATVDHRVDTFPITVNATLWQWLLYEWPFWKAALLGVLGVITTAGGAFGAWKWLGQSKGTA